MSKYPAAFLAIILFLGLTSRAAMAADELQSVEAARTISDQTIQGIAQGKIEESFNKLKAYWPLPPGEIDQLILQMKNQMATISGRFGEPAGYEFVSQQRAGKSLLQLNYLQKFSRHAIVWKFRFYQPEKVWLVNSISFSDKVGELFGSSNSE